MNTYILPLADTRADLETVGGKGMSLARMLNAGLPVPDGFHITTDAYRLFVNKNGLNEPIGKALRNAGIDDPVALELIAQKIAQYFLQGVMPDELKTAITTAYAALHGVPVAVRSSATAEDLPGASFAGQQETYLNIHGTDALLDAVKKCWASLWTARAIAYRLKNRIDQDSVALAVVVQELVFAESAGILFTANPVNGKRTEALINAAWGLGEAVVSGLVTPDTLTVDKLTGKIIQRETEHKLVMTVRTASGVQEQPVPAGLQKKPVLSNRQAAELSKLGVKIESFYGVPMDIEWVFAEGKFAIVQARPITVLPPDWTLPESKALYARGSLAEHLPAPVTPLFATLGLRIANRATDRIWEQFLGKNANALLLGDGFYVTLNGYVYGGMRMGARGIWATIKLTLTQMMPIFRGSVARWQSAYTALAGVVRAWEEKPIESFSSSELLSSVQTVFSESCRYYTVIQTTLPAASSSETLFVNFYNSLIKNKQYPDPLIFLQGFETSALRAEKSLFDLAEWLQTHPELENFVLHTSTDQLLEALKHDDIPGQVDKELWREWAQRFQKHLEEFGRTAYEFDFINPTPYEQPTPLLEVIKNHLNGQAGNPYDRQQNLVARREAATQTVLSQIGWPLRKWFKKLLLWAQETNPMREDSIAGMGMAHPLIRRMLAELGKRLAAAGAIEDYDDIYWLEETEMKTLVTALDNTGQLPCFAEQVTARKANWQAALQYNAPAILPEKSAWNKLMHGAGAETKDGKVILKGVGTSSGVVTAPACVLFGPNDFKKMKTGDVLVAVTTTPAWTPLFTMASAVVTDIGGPLSHSSIVAREYGIPAVMAARSATRLIQNGQIITVDGREGIVVLSEKQQA
jgi:pyruvate,water dikinase